MKALLFVLLLMLPFYSIGKIRAVAITSGGSYPIAAGASTSTLDLHLPAHTTGLIYMLSTDSSKHAREVARPQNLLGQVTTLLAAGVSDISELAAKAVPSSKAALVDVYFYEDRSNGNTALAGVNTGYSLPESRLQFNGGAVGINIPSSHDPLLRLLVIRNVNGDNGVRVLLEAVAMVDDGLE